VHGIESFSHLQAFRFAKQLNFYFYPAGSSRIKFYNQLLLYNIKEKIIAGTPVGI